MPLQILAPDDDLDRLGVAGEVHRGLTGRVAAANHEDATAGESGRFGGRGAVVDARARVLGDTPRGMLPVDHPGPGHHRARDQLAPVDQREALVAGVIATPVTSSGARNSAPRRCAWVSARRVSSLPLTPVGKPR